MLKKIYQFIFFRQNRAAMLCEYSVNGKIRLLKWIIRRTLFYHYHISISPKCKLGKGLILPHPMNIVIGEGAEIGENCTIYQNTTIGQNRYKYPHICNRVIIYANAVIIGDIQIGEDAIVGASAVVTKNIPTKAIAAGVPAKIIGERNCGEFH